MMRKVSSSLRLQVLSAPILAFMAIATLLGITLQDRARLVAELESLERLRHRLTPTLLRVEDRHVRTVRRANEAFLEPRQSTRTAILSSTAEHYLTEMDINLVRLRQELGTARGLFDDTRSLAELARLGVTIDRVTEQSRKVAPHLDALLEAVHQDDADAMLNAVLELERADRAMRALMRASQTTLRRALAIRAARLLGAPPVLGPLPWTLLGAFALFSLLLAARPLGRIGSLARGEPTPPALCVEEEQLARRLANTAGERDELGRKLAEKERELQRTHATARRVEQDLALLRIYNDNLMNSLRAAIVVTDTGLILRNTNRAARDLLAKGETQAGSSLEAQPLFGALSRVTPGVRDELLRSIQEHEPLRYDNLLFTREDGREILLDLMITPYMDESGVARGLLFLADDVTEAMRIKHQLIASERLAAMGRLSAQVAHEIRNPLSAIGLNAELLSEDLAALPDEPRRKEAATILSSITREVARLTEITEGYLNLARMPSPSLVPTDLHKLIIDLSGFLQEELRAQKTNLELTLGSPNAVARIDAGQLRQALLNILRNSREAMPDGGTIHITTRDDADALAIVVTDDGPGFSSEALRRVFEPFFSTKAAGSGLGLSLSRQVVREHGGDIDVANRNEGGARVTLTIPVMPKKHNAKNAHYTKDAT